MLMRSRVTTNKGPVLGEPKLAYDGRAFTRYAGIPYAKPPIGELRFKGPMKPDAWTEPIEPEPVTAPPTHPELNEYRHILESEEKLLVLNVYTPAVITQSRYKPVMVWIAGDLTMPAIKKSTFYGAEYFMTESVILVTVSYRMGIFGFLSHPNKKYELFGNAGLKDILMALKWVQGEISKFRGDANNVTIFGQGFGAAAIHYLLRTPKAKGMFHKAIIQSGCADNWWARGRVNSSVLLARKMGCRSVNDDEIINFLYKRTTRQLLQAQESIIKRYDASEMPIFGPVLDASIINEWPICSQEPYSICIDVPLLIGFNSEEGMFIENIPTEDVDVTDLEQIIPYDVPGNQSRALNIVISSYFNEDPNGKKVASIYRILTDGYFLHGIYQFIERRIKRTEKPIYLYKFNYETGLNVFKNRSNIEVPGACHGDELGYLFQTPFALGTSLTCEESICRNRVLSAWTSFARDGNPNVKKWAPITKISDLKYAEFKRGLGEIDCSQSFPNRDRVKLWQTLYGEHVATKL